MCASSDVRASRSGRVAYLLLGVGSAVVSLVCAFLSRPTARVQSGPLIADRPVRDLGQLRQGAVVPIDFELTNRGRCSLVLKRVFKSCTCAEAELAQGALEPGESTTLKAVLQTGVARGAFAMRLGVAYQQEGTEEAFLPLQVVAEVTPDIQYDPQVVEFVGEERTKVVTFSWDYDGEAPVKWAGPSHRAFRAEVRPDRATVDVTFDRQQWPASEAPAVDLVVQTASKNESILRIPMRVK